MSQVICPKCNFGAPYESQECPACGIVFSKLTDLESTPDKQVMGNTALMEHWADIVSNYTDDQAHEEFIQKALGYKKLNFASQQYRKMIELNPNDETAKAMQNKIIQIASMQFMSEQGSRGFAKAPKWTSALIAAVSVVLFIGLFTGNVLMLWAGVVGLIISFAIRYSKSRA